MKARLPFRNVTLGISVLIALGVVVLSVLLLTRRSSAPRLSVVFDRYGTVTTRDPVLMDLFVQDVAFLLLTNSSDKPYLMAMEGGTNTFLLDSPMGLQTSGDSSYMPMCEFSDQPQTGAAPAPVSFGNLGRCLGVEPHRAVRLRVPLPPAGQTRRIAVICTEMPSDIRPFWTNSIGNVLLRVLPRQVARHVIWRPPPVLKVWCDRELTHRAAVAAQKYPNRQ